MLNNIRDRLKYFTRSRIEPQHLSQIRVDLLEESTLNIDYVVLILGSCVIATLGLLANSAAVIIGAMIGCASDVANPRISIWSGRR